MSRTTLKLDTSGLAPLLHKLAKMEGNVRKAVEDALEQSADTISEDTHEALSAANLPAKGIYSTGATDRSVIDDSRVRWESGGVAWVPVGFDFSKPGAGGYLISGTPRMRPDAKLKRMYKGKKYMYGIQQDMWDVVADYVTGVAK